MRASFIGRGPEAHTARTDLVQRTPLISLETPDAVSATQWSDIVHGTGVTILTTVEEGWPDVDRLARCVAAVLDVASFKSRRHGIVFVGPMHGAAFEALRRREDLCWYAHTEAIDARIHCDDLEGQRILERLLGAPTQGVLVAVAA